jgi:hypothetical protein
MVKYFNLNSLPMLGSKPRIFLFFINFHMLYSSATPAPHVDVQDGEFILTSGTMVEHSPHPEVKGLSLALSAITERGR